MNFSRAEQEFLPDPGRRDGLPERLGELFGHLWRMEIGVVGTVPQDGVDELARLALVVGEGVPGAGQ